MLFYLHSSIPVVGRSCPSSVLDSPTTTTTTIIIVMTNVVKHYDLGLIYSWLLKVSDLTEILFFESFPPKKGIKWKINRKNREESCT